MGFLYSRPRGGLNDTLCQMEKSVRYAFRYRRSLVFETNFSNLSLPFDRVFEVLDAELKGHLAEIGTLTEADLAGSSVFPVELSGRVGTYLADIDPASRVYRERDTGARVSLNFRRRRRETIVVHEGEGGGVDSLCFIRRVQLKSWLRSRIEQRLESMPSEYVSLHIRNTDLQSDYRKLIEGAKALRGAFPIFIATDDELVADFARNTIAPENLILSPSAKGNRSEPLHLSASRELTSSEDRLADLFSDLACLATATKFVFSNVRQGRRVSGFSRLAQHLTINRGLRENFFGFRNQNAPQLRQKAIHLGSQPERALEQVRWIRRTRCLAQMQTRAGL